MRLVITRQAEKDLAGLDKRVRIRIRAALDKMLTNVQSIDLKKLEGYTDLWRLRVGDWRVILRIVGKEVTVYALRIKHRKEVYKK